MGDGVGKDDSKFRRKAISHALDEQVVTSRSERCSDCGWELRFPSITIQCVYTVCPLCAKILTPPTALGIPPPHPQIDDKKPYPLCMARVNLKGRETRCERKRLEKSDYCRNHTQALETHGSLPYGRYGQPYNEPHPLIVKARIFDETALEDDEPTEGKGAEDYLTHDSIVAAAKEASKRRDLNAADTQLLLRARNVVDKRIQKGVLKTNPMTTMTMKKILEPTYGIDLKSQGPGRLLWLKESVQAVMSLPRVPLSVIAAVVGHRLESHKCHDVVAPLTKLIKKGGGQQLSISNKENIMELLLADDDDKGQFDPMEADPCPGSRIFLRIRYCLEGTIGELCFEIHRDRNYCIEESFMIRVPHPSDIAIYSRLTIVQATYGHPHDPKRVFNVTGHVQGVVDTVGLGRYAEFPADESLEKYFGEPCFGIGKTLEISYILDPKVGEILIPEAHGYLLKNVKISAPIISPLVKIVFATLAPKATMGRTFGARGNAKTRLLNYSYYNASSTRGKKTSIRCLDDQTIVCTEDIRRIVDQQGGDTLNVAKDVDVFSLLSKNIKELRKKNWGKVMTLHIEYRCNSMLKEIKVDTTKEHRLCDELFIDARPVDPIIMINSAVYGHPTDVNLQFNVQEILEARVRKCAGRILEIHETEDLNKLFGDPCFPYHTNKLLQIRYQVRRMTGKKTESVTIHSKLSQVVKIGWPTSPLYKPS
mmetsp:Transcript_11991/g.22117  ORF Transcript_11991/g.22117 Transcript_11991/m.22117 type:complete len:707 (+) Transcript_11991:2748-4868(+)